MLRTVWTMTAALPMIAACASQPAPQVAQTDVTQANDASGPASQPVPAAGETQQARAPGGATPAEAPQAKPEPLKECSGSVEIAPDGMIDDAEDNNIQVLDLGGRGRGKWEVQLGGKAVGAPNEPFRMSEGGAEDSGYAARLKGTAPEGSFALLVLKVGYPYDASRYAGITFYAKRGEDSLPAWRFRVADKNTWPDGKVCTSCFDDFGSDLYLTDEWKKYTVRFADMTNAGWGKPKMEHVDPATIYMMGFQTKGAGDFDIWIDDIAFVNCI